MSKKGVIPICFSAEPQVAGIIAPDKTPDLKPLFMSSGLISPLSKYFSMRFSSDSAISSIIVSRMFSASSFSSAGISATLYEPLGSSKIYAFWEIRSIIPLKFSSAPMGMKTGVTFLIRVLIVSRAFEKLARSRSILLMKTIRGNLY
ncbi:MAG: hypothetical protein A4E66_01944 [Syntrophus sp. PtaB.Bin001]|nr:MAG: hypothetical protein A4E66_01944 [Syntrophus sp. PtaB.Bin001]